VLQIFDEQSFAAASIAQVHHATFRDLDGNLHDVVVKVQYLGVARSIESGLWIYCRRTFLDQNDEPFDFQPSKISTRMSEDMSGSVASFVVDLWEFGNWVGCLSIVSVGYYLK
jgi:hypothetical protein